MYTAAPYTSLGHDEDVCCVHVENNRWSCRICDQMQGQGPGKLGGAFIGRAEVMSWARRRVMD